MKLFHGVKAYNRYTYVMNNPLKYTDPSGHGFWSVFKNILGAFVGALLSTVGFLLTPINPLLGLSLMAAGGIIGGAISGGLKGALWGLAGVGIGGVIVGAIRGGWRGALFGLATQALNMATGGLTQGLGQFAKVAIALGAGLGLSYAIGGWQAMVTFGAASLGALAGSGLLGAMKGGEGGTHEENGGFDQSGGESSTQDSIKGSIDYLEKNQDQIPEGRGVVAELKRMQAEGKIRIGQLKPGTRAQYELDTKSITINANQDSKYYPGRLAHEGTHAYWDSVGRPYNLPNEQAAFNAGAVIDESLGLQSNRPTLQDFKTQYPRLFQ